MPRCSSACFASTSAESADRNSWLCVQQRTLVHAINWINMNISHTS